MNQPPTTTAIQPPRRGRKIFIILAVLSLLLISAGAAAYWWHNRPITPVVLNASEQLTLDQKLEVTQKRTYQPGDKTITLSEREVNALFHHNTGLGDKVHWALANDAIHARVRTKLDDDLPVLGGQTLKLKARFLLKDAEQHPAIILDDITVWGISLPNAWLAELKGKNLIADLGISPSKNAAQPNASSGIESIQVTDGQITIKLAD